jgi:hypothetical protein
MFVSIFSWILISVIFIFLAHHLFLYFKENLTVPKVKDLVNEPHQQYKDILKTIQTKENKNMIEKENNDKMADELKQHLSNLDNEVIGKNDAFNTANNPFNTNFSEPSEPSEEPPPVISPPEASAPPVSASPSDSASFSAY